MAKFGILPLGNMQNENLITSSAVGKFVQTERKRQGLPQLQLSGLANTGMRFISDLENGKRIVKCCSLMVCIVCALSELYAGNVPVQTDLSPYWTIAANTNVIKSLGSDELVGSWKAHRYYIRRDTKDSKPHTAMGESTELFTLGQDGRANGVINIKDYRRKKYSGTWSYTNEVLLLPPQSVGSTNSIAYKVVWRTPDEIELRFVDLVYSRDGLEHHGVYDADGNLFVHCKTTSKSGEATTTELVQSVGIFKRQQNLK